jgi:hypothetical protein
MSKPKARITPRGVSGYETSIPRTALAIGLVLLGIIYMVVYYLVARDAALGIPGADGKKASNPMPWMADLKLWNYAIGFGLIFIGLFVSANKKTPAGRGRGVVIGMLGCFIVGLIWIVVFYFVNGGSSGVEVPVMSDLGQWNLVLGIALMAVGFAYATKWE